MDNELIGELAGNSRNTRHNLSDWLSLHELDPVTCRRILEAIPHAACEPAARKRSYQGYKATAVEVAWSKTGEAMRQFLPEQRSIIDDTLEKTVKLVVDRGVKTRKALTLDRGAAAYPVIMFSYRGEPSDVLIIAHEFGHALQIRASQGRFVPPVIREVCAFLGEGALLSHALQSDAAQHASLIQEWKRSNSNYLGLHRERLQADLLQPDVLYRYSWNYPIARYLAIEIIERCPRDWIWSIFEGKMSLQEVLRELPIPLSEG